MVPQGAKAKPSLLEPFNQRLQHGGRPGVLARPDPQVGQQNVATAHIAQRLVQQHSIAGRLAGQLIAQKASGRPTHMRVATGLCAGNQLCRGLAARRAEQGQRRFAGNGLQTIRCVGDFFAVFSRRHHKTLPLTRSRRGANTKRRVLRVASIGAPVGVVPGMGGKLMSLCSACTPPRSPMVSQASIALLRALVGGKEGHVHLLAFEDLRHQRRHLHVAGVKGQIEGLFAVILRSSASETCPSRYQYNSIATPAVCCTKSAEKHTSDRLCNAQRGACCKVHTPWGDLPTLT